MSLLRVHTVPTSSVLRSPTTTRGTPVAITPAQFSAAQRLPLTGMVPADSPLAKYVAPANVGPPTYVPPPAPSAYVPPERPNYGAVTQLQQAPRIITTTAPPPQPMLPTPLVKPVALSPMVAAPQPGQNMSLLGNIGSVAGQIGQVAGQVGGAISAIGGLFRSPGAPPAPGLPALPSGFTGGLPGAIGGAVGSFVGTALKPSGGCGCNGSSGRDACTRQMMTSQPAPLATFFGGCCPPGRVLRRKPMGRDICIKQPRMNPFNPRALARADRRITSFVRRAAPILSDMGFNVERRRKPPKNVRIGGRKRRRG